MFTTSLAAVAVAGLLASGSIETAPAWQTDYRTARSQAAEQKKPVAVFIGAGTVGKLVTDGVISDAAAKTLKTEYVCLYVDTTTPAGKDLAKAFGLDRGLVISDRTGDLQALRHTGPVSAADLNGYVAKFSTTTTVVTTESNVSHQTGTTAPATGDYPGMSTCPGGNCGAVSGGCPGGNCGGSSFGGRRR